jgi:hypothetical protein
VGNVEGEVKVNLVDGIYQNILYPNSVEVKDGKVELTEKPMVLFALKKNV